MPNYSPEEIVPSREGNIEYEVKWVGFTNPTWEPKQSLTTESIELFENPTKVIEPRASEEDDEEIGADLSGNAKYEVERIIRGKKVGVEYLVKWKNYPEPTWTYKRDLKSKSALELINNYELAKMILL